MEASRLRSGLWLCLALCAGLTLPANAQGSAKSLAYDIVIIKPNNSGPGSVSVSIDDDIYKGTNVSLKTLIQYAWDLKTQEQIVGLSGWANSAGLDVQAKMDADTLAQFKALPKEAQDREQRRMMQAVLADRFQLKIHHETRDLPIYELVLAKGGSRLAASDPTEAHPNGIAWPDGKSHAGSINVHNTDLTAQGIEVSALVEYLSGRLRRYVVDRTALTGKFDFTLHSARDNAPADTADDAPPLLTALQEQLGLKLESARGPVDTIVVDHFEQASEN